MTLNHINPTFKVSRRSPNCIVVENNCPGLIDLKLLEGGSPDRGIKVENISLRKDIVYGEEWSCEELFEWVQSLAYDGKSFYDRPEVILLEEHYDYIFALVSWLFPLFFGAVTTFFLSLLFFYSGLSMIPSLFTAGFVSILITNILLD